MKLLISILFVFISFISSSQIVPNFGKDLRLEDPNKYFSCWIHDIDEFNKTVKEQTKLVPEIDLDFSQMKLNKYVYGKNITFENYNNDNPLGKVFVKTCFTNSIQYGKFEGVHSEIDGLGNIIREFSIQNDTIMKINLIN